MQAFKPHLSSPAEYPYLRSDARVKLDQNESPEDLPAELKARALQRLAALPWNRYPELHAEDLRAAVARHEGWDEAGVVLSPGSNVLILALCTAARTVLDTVPSFPYYRGGAEAAGTPWRGIPLLPDFALPRAALLEALDGPPGVLFLPVPHAPTGRLFEAQDVEALAARAGERGWLLLVDEAYHDFSGTDFRGLARRSEHVAVLRTFSKAWCLGGIRAGYLLASPRVAAVARACVPPFCLPAHTAAILQTALESPGYAVALAERIRAERERLRSALERHTAWRVYPSATNFLLVRTADAAATQARLLAAGVLVRRQDRYPGMEGCLRITVGSPAEDDALVEAARGAR
ncbi:MAG TPA: aminotransferase class I/II-fold pyridoxal phosphate-dependent enzyme [Anaeromyxobacter sp.]|nr:aminotransferase class I/II-fold pyridoxal phosphate-dependent enzyme [Anaeromyxobacter sp.]